MKKFKSIIIDSIYITYKFNGKVTKKSYWNPTTKIHFKNDILLIEKAELAFIKQLENDKIINDVVNDDERRVLLSDPLDDFQIGPSKISKNKPYM